MSIDAMKQALEHVQEFKRCWWAVPPFGNKVNKATREAVSAAHSPIFQLEAALRTAIEQAEKQEPVANEMPLHIIRKWPEGFQERLQHVWLDVVSFIPEVKLWDLQRMLAEFGFTMKVYDGAAPPQRQRQPLTQEGKRKMVASYFAEDWAIDAALMMLDDYERALGIGGEA